MKKNSFLLLIFLLPLFSFAQKSSLAAKVKVTDSSVILRWAPADLKTWEAAKKHGYMIQRAEVENESSASIINWKNISSLNNTPFFPWKDNDSLWKEQINKNENLFLIYNALYPEKVSRFVNPNEKKAATENLFFLGLMVCDIYPDAARAAALYFSDEQADRNKKYAYRISIPGTAILPAVVFCNMQMPEYPSVSSLRAVSKNQSSVLSWEIKNTGMYYSSWIIERSDDSIHFVRLNDFPHVVMASQFEKNKTETYFLDSTVEKKKKYWYRVKGKDHFGGYGPVSNVVSCISYPDLKGAAELDTFFVQDDSLLKIYYYLTDSSEIPEIKSHGVLWSEYIDGKYSFLSSKNGETNHITCSRTNYYKMFVTGFNNDTVFSHPYLVLLPDKTPPPVPEIISGTSDRKGIIKIAWKPVKENQLMGYRVYRSNFLHEEFTEVTGNFLQDTFFTDTVSLETLTEEIYYRVNAVDKNYNNSAYSLPIKIKKPDIIPPVMAVITDIHYEKNKIILQWNNSTSEDVASTEIWRSSLLTGFNKIFVAANNENSFADSSAVPDSCYYYKTVVVDDANNFTESQPVYGCNLSVLYPAIDSVSFSVNRDKKNISLAWKYEYAGVEKYILYKSKKGEPPRICKTLPGDVNFYQDKELHIGNQYVYYLRAVFQNGKESVLGDGWEVEY